jgi:hypothetical protein
MKHETKYLAKQSTSIAGVALGIQSVALTQKLTSLAVALHPHNKRKERIQEVIKHEPANDVAGFRRGTQTLTAQGVKRRLLKSNDRLRLCQCVNK